MDSYYSKNGYEIKKNIVTKEQYALLEDLVNNEDRRRSLECLYFKENIIVCTVIHSISIILSLYFMTYDFERFHYEHYNIYLILYITSIFFALYSFIAFPVSIIKLISKTKNDRKQTLNHYVLLTPIEMKSLIKMGSNFIRIVSYTKNGNTHFLRADHREITYLKQEIDEKTPR